MNKCINGWTKQSMIKHIEDNFTVKSFKELPGKEVCLYRGPNNSKCAVGIFIPDNLYYESMEKKSADHLFTEYPVLNKYMPLEPSIMQELQKIHDRSEPQNTKKEILNWIETNVYE